MDLQGKIILITGATDGIGLLTAEKLARDGAHILLHGRSDERLAQAAQKLSAISDMPHHLSYLDPFKADFSRLDDVHQLVARLAELPRIDALINNAGAGAPKEDKRELSQDGFELLWAVNFLAPFALTEGLIAAGKAPPCIVNVASAGQSEIDFDDLLLMQNYEGLEAYRRSKLAMIAWSFELARRQPELCVNALHPGTLLDTKMVREKFGYSLGKPETGAEAIEFVLDQCMSGVTGKYFDVLQEARAKEQAYDPAVQARLVAIAIEQINAD